MEERRATIEQKVALAFAVRLPQSCPDIHTHARRGRLRFEDGPVRACRSRGPAIRACERTLAFPLSQRESDRIENLNQIALVARTCLLGLVSCLRPDALLSTRAAALAPYGLYRSVSDRSRATVRVLRAMIPLVPVSHA